MRDDRDRQKEINSYNIYEKEGERGRYMCAYTHSSFFCKVVQ